MCFFFFSLGFQSQSCQHKQFLAWFPQARPPSPHHHGFVSQEASHAITVFRTNGTRVGTKPCGYCLVKSEVGRYLHFLQSEKIAGYSTLRASLSPVNSYPSQLRILFSWPQFCCRDRLLHSLLTLWACSVSFTCRCISYLKHSKPTHLCCQVGWIYLNKRDRNKW